MLTLDRAMRLTDVTKVILALQHAASGSDSDSDSDSDGFGAGEVT